MEAAKAMRQAKLLYRLAQAPGGVCFFNRGVCFFNPGGVCFFNCRNRPQAVSYNGISGMKFDPNLYGPAVASLLALDADGERLMPLALGACSSPAALSKLRTSVPASLFPDSRAPEAALAGLYLYFSCRDEAHEIAQSIPSPEGAYWHGIVHRQEPDPGNARYWFRQVPSHPIFRDLANAAQSIGVLAAEWDPVRFVEICETARRQPGSPLERMALDMQRAEWQTLFDYCASKRSAGH